MPILRETTELLDERYPDLAYVLPTVSHMEARVRKLIQGWRRQPIVVTGEAEKFDAFAASNVAIAASGTVALELAMARIPNVIIYKFNPVTSWLARKLVKSKYVNLVNILLDEEAVPELILENCRPERIADAASKLLSDADAVGRQRRQLGDALALLSRDGIAPSRAAAQVVLRTMKKGRS